MIEFLVDLIHTTLEDKGFNISGVVLVPYINGVEMSCFSTIGFIHNYPKDHEIDKDSSCIYSGDFLAEFTQMPGNIICRQRSSNSVYKCTDCHFCLSKATKIKLQICTEEDPRTVAEELTSKIEQEHGVKIDQIQIYKE